MRVNSLRSVPFAERMQRAFNQEQATAFCVAVRPYIGGPDLADSNMNRPHDEYRCLLWKREDKDPFYWNKCVFGITGKFPEGLFILSSNYFRVVLKREVDSTAWRSNHSPTVIKRIKIQARERAASVLNLNAPDILGWRVWCWDTKIKALRSPLQRTIWPADGILEAEEYSDDKALRGLSGIHAARLPINWEEARFRHNKELRQSGAITGSEIIIDGIAERFGRAIVADYGWRAERVVIKRLRAPSLKVGLEIEKSYPDINVFYDDSGTDGLFIGNL